MAHHLFLVLSGFFHRYGYWTVFGAALLENICIPVPGEATLLFAGYLARRGQLHLLWAIVAAIAGSIAGEWIGYEIGRWGGKAILDRIRKRFFLPSHTYERSQAIFLKHGEWVIIVARFVSGLRELIGIIAGVYRMSPGKFMLFNCLGAIAWSIAIGGMGYLLGASWRRLVHFFTRINYVAAALFGATVIVLLIRSRLKRRKQNEY
ncbi:MAG: DedA family protein [Terriglobia bacterium]